MTKTKYNTYKYIKIETKYLPMFCIIQYKTHPMCVTRLLFLFLPGFPVEPENWENLEISILSLQIQK